MQKTLVTIHFKGQAADAHLVEVFFFLQLCFTSDGTDEKRVIDREGSSSSQPSF